MPGKGKDPTTFNHGDLKCCGDAFGIVCFGTQANDPGDKMAFRVTGTCESQSDIHLGPIIPRRFVLIACSHIHPHDQEIKPNTSRHEETDMARGWCNYDNVNEVAWE